MPSSIDGRTQASQRSMHRGNRMTSSRPVIRAVRPLALRFATRRTIVIALAFAATGMPLLQDARAQDTYFVADGDGGDDALAFGQYATAAGALAFAFGTGSTAYGSLAGAIGE